MNDDRNEVGGPDSTAKAQHFVPGRNARDDIRAPRRMAPGRAMSDADVQRLVAEFHARGGQVTVCGPVDPASDSPGQSDGRRAAPAGGSDDSEHPAGNDDRAP